MPPAPVRLNLEPLGDRLTPSARGYSVFGATPGGSPLVQVNRPDGTLLARFTALDPSFRGGVRVAAGELDGNPLSVEVVAGYGPGGPPRAVVFSVNEETGLVTRVTSFAAFEDSFRGGVNVGVGDVFGSGSVDQIVVGADTGGGARVRTFFLSGTVAVPTGGPLSDFFAFEPRFRDGVRVAAGNLEADPNGPILLFVAAGRGGGPRVTGLQSDGTAVVDFFALDPNRRDGLAIGFLSNTNGSGLFYAVPAGDDPTQANAGLNTAAGADKVVAAPIQVVPAAPGTVQTVVTDPSTGVAIGGSGLVIATNGIVFGDPTLLAQLGLGSTALIPSNTATNAAVAIAAGTGATNPVGLSRQSLNLLVANGGTPSGMGLIVGSNLSGGSGTNAVVPSGGATDSGPSLSETILNQAVTAALSDFNP